MFQIIYLNYEVDIRHQSTFFISFNLEYFTEALTSISSSNQITKMKRFRDAEAKKQQPPEVFYTKRCS